MCVSLLPVSLVAATGKIVIDGTRDHARTAGLDKLRRKVGTFSSSGTAFPHLSLPENLLLALRKVLGMSRQQRR